MNTREKIYSIKEKKGMTLTQIAKEADVSRDTIMKWDVNSPTVANLQKVANVLGVNILDLIAD